MARAKDVRPGQVWTAKVSGKETKVQIVSELPPAKPGARARFQFKNLTTGRMATGGAGRLHKKISDGGPPGGTPEYADPAPAPLARTRAMPVRRATAPAGRPSPQWQGPGLLEDYHEAEIAESEGGWPEEDFEPPHYNPPQAYGPPPPSYAPPPQQAPPPLESLRARRPRSSRRAARANPSHYPSSTAQSASQAIAASGAQTVHDVLAAVQAWAQGRQGGRYGAHGYAGQPAGYAPHENPRRGWRDYRG